MGAAGGHAGAGGVGRHALVEVGARVGIVGRGVVAAARFEGDVAAVAPADEAREVEIPFDLVGGGARKVVAGVDVLEERVGHAHRVAHKARGVDATQHLVDGTHAVAIERIDVEGGRARIAAGASAAPLVARAERELRERVGVPLQAQAGVNGLVEAVGIGVGGVEAALLGGGDEVFDRRDGLGVVVVAEIEEIAAHFEAAGVVLAAAVLPGEVRTDHGRGGASAVVRREAARAAETAIAHVVVRGDEPHAGAVGEAHAHEFGRIEGAAFVVDAARHVGVRHETLIQLAFGADVEHEALFAVVDACLFGVVALLVVAFHARDEVGGQVFHGHLRVALEKVFPVDEQFLDRLAVDLDRAVVAHFGAGKLLDEGFECGAFGRAEGRSVEDGGVALLLDAGGHGAYHGGAQGHVGAVELNGAHIDAIGLGVGELQVLAGRGEADEAHAQAHRLGLFGDQAEAAEAVGHGAGHEARGVAAQDEAGGGQLEGLAVFFRHNGAGDDALAGHSRDAGGDQEHKRKEACGHKNKEIV